jgi:hypothetical protein
MFCHHIILVFVKKHISLICHLDKREIVKEKANNSLINKIKVHERKCAIKKSKDTSPA